MLYQKQNPHGGDIYRLPVELDFSVNINPLGVPDAVRRAVVASLGCLGQYPDPYCRELVSSIAHFERVPEEYILCGCGAAELIFSYCAAVKPHRALELAPTFSEYSTALEAVSCQMERWPLREETQFSVDASFLRHLETGTWDVLFLCNPNNPTGRLMEPTMLGRVVEICADKGIRVFLDECFLDLTDRGEVLSLKRQLARYPGLLILKAFTKSYGMAGLRLGYCLSADSRLLAAMSRSVQPWNISVPAQAAGAAALGETEFLVRARQIIRAERPWLQEQLKDLGFSVCPSDANYLLFYSPLPLGEKLMELGILIRNCANYHGLRNGWYRAAVKRHEENKKLIHALRGIWKEC